jgi:integrase
MQSITIHDALAAGRAASKCRPEHRKTLEFLGKKVETFAVDTLKIQLFDEFRVPQLKQLVADMEGRGNKPAYIRHVVNTIRLAANYVVDQGGTALHIEQRHLPHREEPDKAWLTFQQIALACRHADTDRRGGRKARLGRLAVLVCGLCGLRITEFLRLVPEALQGANLTIGHAGSETKNHTSRRVIPIPELVADELRTFWADGSRWGTGQDGITKAIRRVLQHAHSVTADVSFIEVCPKDLRKSLPNELEELTPDKWVMAYLGHAFQGELHRAYSALRADPEGFAPSRAKAIDKLKVNVTAHIEKIIQDMHF